MKFFVVDKPTADSPEDRLGGMDVIEEDGFKTGEAPRCPRCGRFLGMLSCLPPYRVELETWGREYGDIVRKGNDLVVSDRFVHMFREAGLKGLSEFEPIEVLRIVNRRRKPIEHPPSYFKTTVTLSPTTVDQRASGYVWEDESAVCPVCLRGTLKRYERVVIDEGSWNGDDVFFPRGGPCIIASERFKGLSEVHGIRGIVFNNPELERYDFFPWETQALLTEKGKKRTS